MQVVKRTESLKRISFLAHSLGGLFARYAVAMLYKPNNSVEQQNEYDSSLTAIPKSLCFSNGGSIAGLEPINFITLATPHLGVRGKKQVCYHRCLIFPLILKLKILSSICCLYNM